MPISEGMIAPAFSAPDQDGQVHTLDQYHGQWVLLYFYPEDDTPGCTKEACQLRDHFQEFQNKMVVLGVSKDSIESHQRFRQKYHLPFTLLSDENQTMITAYEAQGLLTTKRISYLIDPAGKIAKMYPKVDPSTHAKIILQDFEKLETAHD